MTCEIPEARFPIETTIHCKSEKIIRCGLAKFVLLQRKLMICMNSLPSILKPLIPNNAASPWPPGKTYNVGWLNRILPTTSELAINSFKSAGTNDGDTKSISHTHTQLHRKEIIPINSITLKRIDSRTIEIRRKMAYSLMNAFNFSLLESRISTELMRILQCFAYDLSGNLFQWPASAQWISIEIESG